MGWGVAVGRGPERDGDWGWGMPAWHQSEGESGFVAVEIEYGRRSSEAP